MPRHDARQPRRFVFPLLMEEDWARRVGSATDRLMSRQEILFLWRQGTAAGLRGARSEILDRFVSKLAPSLPSVARSVDQWHAAQFRRALAAAQIDIRSEAQVKAAVEAKKDDEALRRADARPIATTTRGTFALPEERVRVSMPDVGFVLERWRKGGTEEILGWGREALARIEDRLEEAWTKGWTEEQTAIAIEEATGASRSQSEARARMQIGALYSELVRERQRKIGVSAYTWVTQRDSRVRPTHRELDGKRFEWGHDPAIGPPGTEPNCRCIAEPDFDDLRERQLRINRQRRAPRRR